MEHLGGKKTCEYYKACGNVENCQRCTGYKKKDKENKRGTIKLFSNTHL